MGEVLARRGADQFLLRTEDGRGQILDVSRDLLYPAHELSALLARGYWSPATAEDVPPHARVFVEAVAEDVITASGASDMTVEGDEFTVHLLREGEPTIDGRTFAEGKTEWREPPLTLMYLVENTHDGHKGSKAGGTISRIWRDGADIYGAGKFFSGQAGQDLKALVEEGVLNGVSSDVGGALVEASADENGTPSQNITGGKIMGATVLPFPAFDDTRISIVASAVPDVPPAEWFADPQLPAPTQLTVTDDGRVFGHAATWSTCHIGRSDRCVQAPRSHSEYGYFHTGKVKVDTGEQVPVGVITLGTGHAGLTLGAKQAAEHYDHTGTVVADVHCGEDAHGIWVAGALRPDVTEGRLRALRAAALSGDWRTIATSGLELVALLAVNTPGFPVPHTEVSLAVEENGTQELAIVAAGVVTKGDCGCGTVECSCDDKQGEAESASDEKSEDPSSEDEEAMKKRVDKLENAIVSLTHAVLARTELGKQK